MCLNLMYCLYVHSSLTRLSPTTLSKRLCPQQAKTVPTATLPTVTVRTVSQKVYKEPWLEPVDRQVE